MRDDALRALVRAMMTESTDEFGYQFGSTSSLYDTFVKPVTDVGKIAGAELKKTAARGKALGKTAIEAVISTLIPILDADYDEIKRDAAEKISAAEAKAGDAYDDVRRALKSSDAVMFALLYNPTATLTAAADTKIARALRSAFGVDESVRAHDKRLAALSASVKSALQEKLKTVAASAREIASAKDAAMLSKALNADPSKLKHVNDLVALKRAAIERLATSLEKETSALVKSGAPKSSSLVKDHAKTVKFIRDIGGKIN